MATAKISALSAATTPLAGTELFEVVQSATSKKVAASDIANTFNGTLAVANGGTGAATLTGYVKGSGTSAMTASSTIPFADLAGRAYLSAYDATDQTGSVSAGTAVQFSNPSLETGITIENDGGGDPTEITYVAAGTYMIATSLQLKNTDSSDHDVTVWFRKNGTDITASATKLVVPKAADGGVMFFQIVVYETVAANDYIEVIWLPENVAVTLEYTASTAGPPAVPAIPSAIVVSERIA